MPALLRLHIAGRTTNPSPAWASGTGLEEDRNAIGAHVPPQTRVKLICLDVNEAAVFRLGCFIAGSSRHSACRRSCARLRAAMRKLHASERKSRAPKNAPEPCQRRR